MNIHSPISTDMLNLPGLKMTRVQHSGTVMTVGVESALSKPDCPNCDAPSAMMHVHGSNQQEFRDIPFGPYRTVLDLKRRRFKCMACSRTTSEDIDCVDGARLMTRRLAEYIVQRCLKATNYAAADDIGLDESTIRAVFKDYVREMDNATPIVTPRVLGIDEIHLDQVLCVLTDVENRRIVDLLPSREKEFLDGYFANMADKHRVEVVVTDMWKSYHKLARVHFPGCPVVVDKFHVVRYAQEGLDKIRLRTGRSRTHEQKIRLKDDRFLLLQRNASLSDEEWKRVKPWLGEFPDLKAAYETKERLSELYEGNDRAKADRALTECVMKIPSHLDEDFKEFLSVVKNWRTEILAYFDNPVTNGYTEGVNAAIRQIDRQGRGYTFEILRARLLYKERRAERHTTIRPKKRRTNPTMSFSDFSTGRWDTFEDLTSAPAELVDYRPTFAEFATSFNEWATETEADTSGQGTG